MHFYTTCGVNFKPIRLQNVQTQDEFVEGISEWIGWSAKISFSFCSYGYVFQGPTF